MENRTTAILVELGIMSDIETMEMFQTHIDEQEVRRSTIGCNASFYLSTKRTRPAGCVRLIEFVNVGHRLAKDELVKEVVNEVHLG